jgi:excisionase family DNA binding protein
MPKTSPNTVLGKIQALVRGLQDQQKEILRRYKDSGEFLEISREIRFELDELRGELAGLRQRVGELNKSSFMTPEDVAGELCIDKSTVLRMYHDGRLPGVRISEKVIRFDRNTVFAAVQGEKQLTQQEG